MWQYNHSDELMHYGVKGMRWGVRRTPAQLGHRPASASQQNGYKVYGDGRIEISKGTELQRLVGKHSKQDLAGMTYASFTKNDNARYMMTLTGKGPLGGGRNTKLVLSATENLKSPSVKEAATTFFEMLRDNPELNDAYSKTPFMSMTSSKFTTKKLNSLIDEVNKTGKSSAYSTANSSLMFDDSGMNSVKEAYFAKLKEKGYNMLRDENDVSNGYAKNPVLIFDGSKSLSIESSAFITNEMRKEAKAYKKETIDAGKSWLQKLGFKKDTALE